MDGDHAQKEEEQKKLSLNKKKEKKRNKLEGSSRVAEISASPSRVSPAVLDPCEKACFKSRLWGGWIRKGTGSCRVICECGRTGEGDCGGSVKWGGGCVCGIRDSQE